MDAYGKKAMRDVFLSALVEKMREDRRIFFLTADFGSPVLDRLSDMFPDRFINVGIAEQNLINVAAGLALENFTVYAYAIAPFITMRCYEQIKVNLALMSQVKAMNVNLVGVGAGFSYVVSGPTHHSVEDISIMRTLPNIEVLSPSDWVMARDMVDFTLACPGPKYLRLDSQPTEAIYPQNVSSFNEKGFNSIRKGSDICMISTGYMTFHALELNKILSYDRIVSTVIDIFRLKNLDSSALAWELSKYKLVVSMEEAFTGKGGLDSLLLNLKNDFGLPFKFKAVGIGDSYKFELGSRGQLLDNYDAGLQSVLDIIRRCL